MALPTSAPARERRRLSPRDDLVTVLLGLWLTVGLFVDGWAHNRLLGLETFFTPWHALFYSGFTACALWTSWIVLREVRTGRRGLAALPLGYGLGAVGVVVFSVGAAGDLAWHTAFGIEEGLEALLSPTHLVLMVAMGLVVTSPLRAACSSPQGDREPGPRAFLPALLALALVTALGSFFLMYLSAFTDASPVMTRAGWPADRGPYPGERHLQVGGIADVLVTNVLLLAPVLLVLCRWRPPFGAFTLLFGLVAGLTNALVAFETVLAALPAALLGGAAADVLVRSLRPGPDRPAALRAVALAVPAMTWSAWFLLLELRWGLRWGPELWSGTILFAVLSGLLLAQLVLAPARPAAAAPRAEDRAG
jgi:hypothetical protein